MTTLSIALTLASPLALAAPQSLELWRHETGNIAEIEVSRAAVERFNRSQDRWRVEMSMIPEGAYTETVTSAAVAGDLPCLLYIDQPVAPNFAWAGFLQPLDGLVDQAVLDGLIATARGTYDGRIYSAGQYEVALSLLSRRSVLEEHGIRIATLDAPWSTGEFVEALETLKASGDFLYPLDLQAGWSGEWYSYAFGPWLIGFGGDQIDRDTYLEAEGVLNGEAALAWGELFQALFADGLVDRNPSDNRGFVQGRVAINYGFLEPSAYPVEWEDDLVVMPVPDFGHGSVIGGGSWHTGITAACTTPEGAAEFLEFLLQPEEIAAMSEGAGMIPASEAGAALTEHYREGGQWRFFYDYSEAHAQLRPETPAYPIISSVFARAGRDIRDGGDVQAALDEAVDAIERNIADNRGYGMGN
ncbi:extracellular solute-binding protein [Halomonas sp. BM-2019]|uniref:ABC transporter substrate-binding protein n=1 Tax=Halomonas sp. BM-2019 TaxID=2811227 RepID=UPI001B3C21BB|nr:MAG: extracellular solute-binding protein [Halomonas sp. BM-2019]